MKVMIVSWRGLRTQIVEPLTQMGLAHLDIFNVDYGELEELILKLTNKGLNVMVTKADERHEYDTILYVDDYLFQQR